MAYENERQVAIEAVLKACRLCQVVRAALVSEETMAKEDRSPVTVADFGSQAVICWDLLKAFPDEPIAAEEDAIGLRTSAGDALKAKVTHHVNAIIPGLTDDEILASIDRGTWGGGPTGRYWVLDPIDGTKGFLRGDQYAVALALIEEGEIVLGVLGCPNLPVDASHPDGPRGSLFVALKGQGASMRPVNDPTSEIRIRVAEVADPVEASYCESVEEDHSSHNRAARIAAILGVTKPPLRIDSQCKYGIVARGDVVTYVRLPQAGYEEKIWDHAAGSIIVQEAGGEVTDVYGHPLDFSRGRTLHHCVGIVATNGKLHARVLAAVQQAMESH